MSQRLANKVCRMKPMACGNHTYDTGTFSSDATISAILFSKPSPLSLEKGMLDGSAHTRSDVRSTRSTRTPSAACALVASTPPSATPTAAARLIVTEAALFILSGRLRFVGPLAGTAAWQHSIRAGFQIDVDVVDVAHDIGVIAERGHDALLAGRYD